MSGRSAAFAPDPPAAEAHHISTRHRLALYVDEDRLRELDEILRTIAPVVLYTVWDADGLRSAGTGIDAVLGAEAGTRAAVSRIVAVADGRRSLAPHCCACVSLGSDGEVEYELTDVDTVRAAERARRLDRWARYATGWYSALATVSEPAILGGLGALTAVSAGLASWWLAARGGPDAVSSTSEMRITAAAAATAIGSVATAASYEYLFPRATFAIGKGVRRERKRARVRAAVLATLVLGLVTGIAYLRSLGAGSPGY
jgi:hypothetical protein